MMNRKGLNYEVFYLDFMSQYEGLNVELIDVNIILNNLNILPLYFVS